jgi:hypothetical protein
MDQRAYPSYWVDPITARFASILMNPDLSLALRTQEPAIPGPLPVYRAGADAKMAETAGLGLRLRRSRN